MPVGCAATNCSAPEPIMADRRLGPVHGVTNSPLCRFSSLKKLLMGRMCMVHSARLGGHPSNSQYQIPGHHNLRCLGAP
jgi:hypothetical protein